MYFFYAFWIDKKNTQTQQGLQVSLIKSLFKPVSAFFLEWANLSKNIFSEMTQKVIANVRLRGQNKCVKKGEE